MKVALQCRGISIAHTKVLNFHASVIFPQSLITYESRTSAYQKQIIACFEYVNNYFPLLSGYANEYSVSS